jgi:flagellar motor component MotA
MELIQPVDAARRRLCDVSNVPFSPNRVRADLIRALPAIGMILGAVLGVVLGLLNSDASAVAFAGIGIGAGLVLGVFLRAVFRRA